MKSGVEGLKVFELAYEGAMQIFALSKSFPVEEKVFANRSNSTVISLGLHQYR